MNIGISGGMGSGKSTVAKSFSEMTGGRLVITDLLCRGLLSPGGQAWSGLRSFAPAEIFLADGEIDRPVMRKILFSNPDFRHRVDDLVHPMVRKKLNELSVLSKEESYNLVVEVPLLFEKGWQTDFDKTILVYAENEICIKRVMLRDNVSRGEAEKAIAAQIPLKEKIGLADDVVNNSFTFAETLEQLESLKKKYFPSVN